MPLLGLSYDNETHRYGISWRTLDEDLCFEYFVPEA